MISPFTAAPTTAEALALLPSQGLNENAMTGKLHPPLLGHLDVLFHSLQPTGIEQALIQIGSQFPPK
jgi:hypothetical protein